MRKTPLFLVIILLLLSSGAWAQVSSPEALTVSSGMVYGEDLSSFSVLGENVAGVIFGGANVSGVGLAAMIFTPFLPIAGEPVPLVNTAETSVISYPNPFNPLRPEEVTVAYKMAEDAEVKTYIFDVTGQLIRTISVSSANRGADGLSRVSWDGRSNFGEVAENGLYLVHIIHQGKTVAKTKVIVMR